MTVELYTTSRLRAWRECPRKHGFRYELGIITPQSHAMAFGTAAHAVLEAWYRAWQAGADRLAAALSAVDAADVFDSDRIKLIVLAVAYHERWGAESWEVIAVEAEFRYWLGDVEMGGKLDALVRDTATDKVYVVEHKTSTADTSPGAPYWDRLVIDTQVSIYTDGAATQFDVEIAGVVYDVIKRPAHEPLLATPEDRRKLTIGKGCKKCGGSAKAGEVTQGRGFYTVSLVTVEEIKCDGCDGTGWKLNKNGKPEVPRPHADVREKDETLDEFRDRLATEVGERIDEFLVRSVVVRLDDELPRMRQELIDTVGSMRVLADRGLAPPNHDACARGREMCPFFAVCAGRQSIDEFPRGEAHPELASAQPDRSNQEAA